MSEAVQTLVSAGKPVLVVPLGPMVHVWDEQHRVTGFVLTDGETVLRADAFAAPFIANAFPAATIIGLGPEVLHWFDKHAHTQPKAFVDAFVLTRIAVACGQPLPTPLVWSGDMRELTDTEIPDTAYLELWHSLAQLRARFREADVRPYAVYADQYLKASTLLALMSGRGYHVGAGYGQPARDGLTHVQWEVKPVPARITTQAPPLHAVPHNRWDAMQARSGSRWVQVTWPGATTAIALRVVARLSETMPELLDELSSLQPSQVTDYLLDAHYVPKPEEDPPLLVSIPALTLKNAWAACAAPWVFPVPMPEDPVTPGKRALMADSAFMVAQLAAMHDAAILLRHRALTGLSDVIPGLGILRFQIDDRVPLPVLENYIRTFHAHHATPVVRLGTHWNALIPMEDPNIEIALQLERPTQMPVRCPVCGGVADCDRDLATHFAEDHPHVP